MHLSPITRTRIRIEFGVSSIVSKFIFNSLQRDSTSCDAILQEAMRRLKCLQWILAVLTNHRLAVLPPLPKR
ncbi:hypothetical protein MKX08_002477 [Trichoderma sp. CBMAI-0020]|nr:hypothetical protein MKX08_002477 [Trichoderma sp. CBMAI-0020]